jgi:hypothetical protein
MIPTNQKTRPTKISAVKHNKVPVGVLHAVIALCRWLHTHMLKNLLSTRRNCIVQCSSWKKIIIWRTTKSFSKHLSRFNSTQKNGGRESIEMTTTRWEFCLFYDFSVCSRNAYFFGCPLTRIAKSQTNTIRCARFSRKLLWTGIQYMKFKIFSSKILKCHIFGAVRQRSHEIWWECESWLKKKMRREWNDNYWGSKIGS